jgi:hypothetical protein
MGTLYILSVFGCVSVGLGVLVIILERVLKTS